MTQNNIDMNVLSKSPSSDSLIEETTYLASLASNLRDIDNFLDTIRLITSRPKKDLSPEDITNLKKTQEQIKDYLINRDPLKSYTASSLEEKLKEHTFNTGIKKQKLLRDIKIFLFLSLPIVILLAVVMTHLPQAEQGRFVFNSLAGLLYLGASWFFFVGRRGFKTQLQHAYLLITLGTVIFLGLFQLLHPFAHAFSHQSSYTIVALQLISFPGFFLIYRGVCQHAALLNIKSRLMGRATVLILLGGSVILTSLLSNLFIYTHIEAHIIIAAASLQGGSLLLALVSAILLYETRAFTGILLARAATWLAFALVSEVIFFSYTYSGILSGAVAHLGAVNLITGTFLAINVLSAVLFFMAGYAFNKAGQE